MKARILLVEDQPHNIRLMQQIIAEIEGDIQVVIATNGKQALDQARKESFDLVLMDIALEDLDGMEITRILREYTHFKDTPIIAVTAYAMLSEQAIFKEIFDDYLSKPVDEDELISTITKWLKGGDQ